MPYTPRASFYRTIVAPCKDCTTRFAGCHSSCSSYKQYKETMKENKKSVYLQTHSERVLEDFSVKAKQKAMKKKHLTQKGVWKNAY